MHLSKSRVNFFAFDAHFWGDGSNDLFKAQEDYWIRTLDPPYILGHQILDCECFKPAKANYISRPERYYLFGELSTCFIHSNLRERQKLKNKNHDKQAKSEASQERKNDLIYISFLCFWDYHFRRFHQAHTDEISFAFLTIRLYKKKSSYIMFLARRRAKKNVVFDNKMRKIANWFFPFSCLLCCYLYFSWSEFNYNADRWLWRKKVPKTKVEISQIYS